MNQDVKSALFEEGLLSYIDALGAFKALYQEVWSRSTQSIEANLDSLEGSLRRSVSRDSIRPYVYPDGTQLNSWDGSSTWVAAKLTVPGLCQVYAGISWWGEHGSSPEPRVIVDFAFDNRQVFANLSQAVRDLTGGTVKIGTYKELFIAEAIGRTDTGCFAERLDGIFKEWIDILGKVPPETYSPAQQ
ncbi:MAG TPA: hypothetical protein VFD30_16135 [Terriglobia bacterium]|nr:hypothetical protein [Terriglobia bacterium]